MPKAPKKEIAKIDKDPLNNPKFKKPPTKKKRGRKRKQPKPKKKRKVEVEGSLAALIKDRRRTKTVKSSKKDKQTDDEKKKQEEEDEEKKQLDLELENGALPIAPMEDIGADDPFDISFPGDDDEVEEEMAPGEGFFCANCKKQFHDPNVLAIHEKIPHFWACKHDGCTLSFETKDESVKHTAEDHKVDQTGTSVTGLDHLVMNSDGTMSFNHLVSKGKRSGGRFKEQEDIEVDKLAKNSKYGGNAVKDGFVNRSSYRARIRNEKWSEADTKKFYKNLSIYGSNFALLAALFKGRTRKQLKSKYKKEERSNPKLIRDALTNRRPMELNIDEFEELVTSNLKAKEDLEQKSEDALFDELVEKKTLTVKEKRMRRQQQAALEKGEVLPLASEATTEGAISSTEVNSTPDRDSQSQGLLLKKEPMNDTEVRRSLELAPPPGAPIAPPPGAPISVNDDVMVLDDDEDSEFDPFG